MRWTAGWKDSVEPNRSFESSHHEDVSPASPAAGGNKPSSFWKRFAGALLGSRRAFAEIAGDPRATWQAVALIVFPGILMDAFGEAEILTLPTGEDARVSDIFGIAQDRLEGLVITVTMALLLRVVSGWLQGRSSSFGGWFRVLGFTSPIEVLMTIPTYGWIAVLIYGSILYVLATRELAATNTRTAIGIVLTSIVGLILIYRTLRLLQNPQKFFDANIVIG